MVNPQLKNGYTKIANEILEAIARFPFNGSQLRLIIFLLRKTYGFNKKEDYISLSQWVLGTNLSRRNVIRELKNLRKMNVILQNNKGFKKDASAWKKVTSLSLPYIGNIGDKSVMVTSLSLTGDKSVTLGVTNQSPLTVFTKETITKETIQKTPPFPLNGKFQEIWTRYPVKDGMKQAQRHFKASVLTEQDWQKINKALDNYLASKRVQDGFIKNGATWFNNWKDWIDYVDHQTIVKF